MADSLQENHAQARLMELTNNGDADQAPARNGARSYPRMLPEWALELLRPLVKLLSQLLWGLRWQGRENIPAAGGVIVAANHQTYIDPFWIACRIHRPIRFLAWDVAFNWPVVGPFLRLFGAWPLQLEGVDPAPIRRSLQWISEGGAVVIFPEGGRGNPDGSLKKFKAGAARMALEARVPILPVTIRGGERVWPSTHRLPRFRRGVEVVYHPLVTIEQLEGQGTRECARKETQRLAEIIELDLVS